MLPPLRTIGYQNISENLHKVLNNCLQIVNSVVNPINKAKDSDHKYLLQYSHTQWVSRNKILKSVFDLRILIFF